MLRKLLALALVLTMVAVLGHAGQKKAYLGVAIHSTDNEYWNQQAEGCKLFAASLPEGAMEVQILTCDGDDEKQLNGIKAFIASHGRDAMIYVDPSNAPNTAAIAEVCEDAGVYWTAVWHLAEGLSPMDYKYFVMYQTPDGRQQGYDIATRLFKDFKTPNKGKFLALQGQLGNDSAVARYAGLQKAMAENPGVEMLELQVCDWNAQRALNTTETWLAKYTDFDGIWAANDDMAIGALQALKAKGLNGKVKLVGIDGVSAAFAAIDDGDMICTVASNGFLQGGYGAAYVYYAWAGKYDPAKLPAGQRAFYTKGLLVDKSNLEEYRDNFVRSVPKYDFTDLTFPILGPFDVVNR